MAVTAKKCGTCKAEKPLTDFGRDSQAKDGYRHQCSPCRELRRKLLYVRNAEKLRERAKWASKKHKYGVSQRDFDAMLQAQSGRCAICKEEYDEVLCVDHDHKTGQVRGLLCRGCNLAIGYMKDNPDRLMAAASYLRTD